MTQMQGKSRRSYASAGAYVDGSSALKEAAQPVYVPVSYTHLDVYKRQFSAYGKDFRTLTDGQLIQRHEIPSIVVD